jgi:23S rRNA (cytidine1920-2'-O)/16S rRNA (cytidine1409-2'-O)-methyltransferase
LGRKGRIPLRKLTAELARTHPYIDNPEQTIAAGHVLVDGWPVTNPASLVPAGAKITVRRRDPLRGEAKLRAALEAFSVPVEGRVALDLGAAAGGFTRVLLEAGAARVYAVDVGYGQLLGSLRQDTRVVNLERTNIAALDTTLVPEPIDLVTIDLSYLSIASAARQLDDVRIVAGAELIGLVKPAFELGLAAPPVDAPTLEAALSHARRGLEAAGWRVTGAMRSPVLGGRGAIEFLIHALLESPSHARSRSGPPRRAPRAPRAHRPGC